MSAGWITHVGAWWLKLPLTEPYFNALGPLAGFDAIMLRIEAADGREGWGEACPVAGYSPETPQEAWDFMRVAAGELAGGPLGAVDPYARAHHRRYPFAASALAEAAARLRADALLAPADAPFAIELAGTVNTLSLEDAPARALDLVGKGYRTLKVKVGYDPATDAARVNAIAAAVGQRAKLRVDANQGYGPDSALAFARAVQREAIEVFEQPLPADAWDDLAAVAKRIGLPMMLDESIYDAGDITRAARETGAAAVKLKMSKSGGPAALRDQAQRARDMGLKVVIGNGVASDLGCLHEALCFARLGIETAGELNGFLKLREPLLTRPLNFEAPFVRVPPGPLAAPEPSKLERFSCARTDGGRARAAAASR